jgi:hypothetical protein
LAVVEVGGEGGVFTPDLIKEPGVELGSVVGREIQGLLGLEMQGEAEEFCGVGPGEVNGLGFLGFGRSRHRDVERGIVLE